MQFHELPHLYHPIMHCPPRSRCPSPHSRCPSPRWRCPPLPRLVETQSTWSRRAVLEIKCHLFDQLSEETAVDRPGLPHSNVRKTFDIIGMPILTLYFSKRGHPSILDSQVFLFFSVAAEDNERREELAHAVDGKSAGDVATAPCVTRSAAVEASIGVGF